MTRDRIDWFRVRWYSACLLFCLSFYAGFFFLALGVAAFIRGILS